MLALTSYLGGDPADSHQSFAELRDLTSQSGDQLSLALGMAGHMILLSQVSSTQEAAAMAREVAALVRVIEADEALKFELLNSVTLTQFLNCDVADAFDAPVYFSQPVNALVFRSDIFGRSMPARDLQLLSVMQTCMEQLGPTSAADGLFDRICAAIRMRLRRR